MEVKYGMTETPDLVIMGAGPGGYVAALRASQLGARVTLVEKGEIGGVCLNWGCIPTKALIRSAEVYSTVKSASRFGVKTSAPTVDWDAMQDRKRKIVGQLTGNVAKLLDRAGVKTVFGEASFVSPTEITVGTSSGTVRLSAQRFIVATGSSPAVIPVPGLDLPQVWDSTAALDVDALPRSLLIIGGGAIGVEFADLFSTLGVAVTLVEMLPRLLPTMDSDIGAALQWTLESSQVVVKTGTQVTRVTPAASGGLAVETQTPGGTEAHSVDNVLVAVGRKPNTAGLGLEKAGVAFGRTGITADATTRTNVSHIHAIGDVTGGLLLAHVASREGEVAAENLLGHTASIDHRYVPGCVFSHPEAASVGLSQEAAQDQGYDVRVGRYPFNGNGKALADGGPDGFVKVVAESKYDQVLGVHIVGPHASDLILEASALLTLECTLDEMTAIIRPHPTLGEALTEAALAVSGKAIHLPKPVGQG